MKKLIIIITSLLLLSNITVLYAIAGDIENPEFEDKIRDVKLFGIFPLLIQFNYVYVDVISAWIFELEENPDYLYMNLRIRDLRDNTDKYDAIYVLSWTYNNIKYSASVHIFPEGPTSLKAGPTDEEGNDYIDYVICDGNIDSNTEIITWIIPKDIIGNPTIGTKITNFIPHTHLRYPESTGFPLIDLFKDLPWNSKIMNDYQIMY